MNSPFLHIATYSLQNIYSQTMSHVLYEYLLSQVTWRAYRVPALRFMHHMTSLKGDFFPQLSIPNIYNIIWPLLLALGITRNIYLSFFVCLYTSWKLVFVGWRVYFYRKDLVNCPLCIWYTTLQILENVFPNDTTFIIY